MSSKKEENKEDIRLTREELEDIIETTLRRTMEPAHQPGLKMCPLGLEEKEKKEKLEKDVKEAIDFIRNFKWVLRGGSLFLFYLILWALKDVYSTVAPHIKDIIHSLTAR